MTTFLQDVRYAFRSFRKSPGFAFVAVATLALGIGANAAIFALVDRVLLTLLPVRNPQELVLLRSPGPAQGHTWSDGDNASSFSYPMYRDLRDSNTVFAGLLAEYPFDASVSARGGTERASGELVSGNYFEVLGVPPSLGRNLAAQDDRAPGAHPQTVLSHGYWTRRFGNDPSVLNKTIVVNGLPLTVVGVARAGFAGIQPGRPADLFVPMMMKAQMTPFWNGLDDPKDYWLQMVGRLKSGLSPARAEAELQGTYRPLLEAQLPLMTGWDDNRRRQFLNKKLLLVAGGHGRAVLREGYGTPLVSLMGMVLVVLLIACSNLAGLLAARGAARQREYGIRLAMGASRMQLLRQSIVECLLFAFAGGALGLLVAAWTLHTLLAAFPPDADLRQVAAQIDPRVLGFAALVSLTAGVFFGVSPALRAARLDPARTLRGQGRGTVSAARDVLRFRRGLVTAQVALTLVLLVGAGLFVSSLQNLGRVDLGLKPDRVLGFSIAPKLNAYSAARTAELARRLTEAVAALPGVRSVSAAELSTLTDNTSGTNVKVEGAEPSPSDNRVLYNRIGPEYFATLGIPLVAGREIAWTDDAGAPKVAVINEAMARRFFPGGTPSARDWLSAAGSTSPPIPRSWESSATASPRRSRKRRGRSSTCRTSRTRSSGELTFYVRAANDPATPRLGDPRAGPQARLRAPDLRRQEPPRSDQRFARHAAADHVVVRRLRRARRAARGPRDLRRPRVLGRPAAPGDRRAHRARRAGLLRARIDLLRGGPLPSHRRGDRPPGRVRARARRRVDPLRRPRLRPPCLRVRRGADGRRLLRGRLARRPPRRAHRPDGSPAQRVR